MSLKIDTAVIHAAPNMSVPPQAERLVCEAARNGKIIAFPTDTVYGLGSTGLIKAASRRIYQIKARPSIKPLPILVHSADEARRWVLWTPTAEKLARHFWPGALTLVLKPTEEGRLLTFGEYQTVALRVPNLPLLQNIIRDSGVPWVSTSANISGSSALTRAEDVVKTFNGVVDFIIAGGQAPGIESSVVDATASAPRVLREGKIPSAKIFEICQALRPAPAPNPS